MIGRTTPASRMRLAKQVVCGKFDVFLSALEQERERGGIERELDEWMRKGEISLGGLYQL